MKTVPPELVPSYLNRIVFSVFIMIFISALAAAPLSSLTLFVSVLIGDWSWWNSHGDDSGFGY